MGDRIDKLLGMVEGMASEMGSMKSEMGEMNGRVGRLESGMGEMKSEMGEMNGRVGRLEEYVVIIADRTADTRDNLDQAKVHILREIEYSRKESEIRLSDTRDSINVRLSKSAAENADMAKTVVSATATLEKFMGTASHTPEIVDAGLQHANKSYIRLHEIVDELRREMAELERIVRAGPGGG